MTITAPTPRPWRWVQPWRRLARHPPALLAACFIAVLLVVAVAGEAAAPHDPDSQSLTERFLPPAWEAGGTWSHPLGTDNLGRDVLSRIIVGTRLSLLIGGLSDVGAAAIGVTIGLVGAYVGGWRSVALARLTDLQMALPGLLVIIAVVGVYGPSVSLLILLFIILGWMISARLIRAQTLSLTSSSFIEAARSSGASDLRIMFRHILPNVMPTAVVVVIIELPPFILGEASISFLGFGVQPPDTSWGLLLAEGRRYMTVAWWVSIFPGIAVFMTLLSLTVLANWVQGEIDPVARAGSGRR
ncbi:MAG: ABC transporter permease [Dehalococcoidia bacterium]